MPSTRNTRSKTAVTPFGNVSLTDWYPWSIQPEQIPLPNQYQNFFGILPAELATMKTLLKQALKDTEIFDPSYIFHAKSQYEAATKAAAKQFIRDNREMCSGRGKKGETPFWFEEDRVRATQAMVDQTFLAENPILTAKRKYNQLKRPHAATNPLPEEDAKRMRLNEGAPAPLIAGQNPSRQWNAINVAHSVFPHQVVVGDLPDYESEDQDGVIEPQAYDDDEEYEEDEVQARGLPDDEPQADLISMTCPPDSEDGEIVAAEDGPENLQDEDSAEQLRQAHLRLDKHRQEQSALVAARHRPTLERLGLLDGQPGHLWASSQRRSSPSAPLPSLPSPAVDSEGSPVLPQPRPAPRQQPPQAPPASPRQPQQTPPPPPPFPDNLFQYPTVVIAEGTSVTPMRELHHCIIRAQRLIPLRSQPIRDWFPLNDFLRTDFITAGYPLYMADMFEYSFERFKTMLRNSVVGYDEEFDVVWMDVLRPDGYVEQLALWEAHHWRGALLCVQASGGGIFNVQRRLHA